MFGTFAIWLTSPGNRSVEVRNVDSSLQESDVLDVISIHDDPSVPQTGANNVVAYRPNFADLHGSNLGALFFNLEAIFPCIPSDLRYAHCTLFTTEEDGFHFGVPIIQAADRGNNFRIFSTSESILTYAIAVQGCPQLNETCLPAWQEQAVVCQLPRPDCN